MTALAATLACAVACLTLVGAEYRKARALRAASKALASLSFIAVGLAALATCPAGAPSWPGYQRWVLVGLALGAAGDIALLGASRTAFLAGLGAFLLGHVSYVVAIAQLVAPAAWLGRAGVLAVVPIASGLVVLRWLWPRLGTMRGPVIAYVITIVVMVVAALAAHGATDVAATSRHLLAIGATLFFASDLAVARDRFVANELVNRVWGLPCYYAGQLLIAWSLATGASGPC